MKAFAITLAYLCASVSAGRTSKRQTSDQIPSVGVTGAGGPGSFAGFLPDELAKKEEEFFEHAGRTPNQTSSASFESFNGDQWSWTVNVTEAAVPYEFFNTSGLHVVNTQWDLQWPGGGSLQSYMARKGSNGTVCFSGAQLTLPSNITDRYSGTGNCSAVLGSECAASVLATFDCPGSGSLSLSESLAGCEDILIPQRFSDGGFDLGRC
jgi:hypothetical protein